MPAFYIFKRHCLLEKGNFSSIYSRFIEKIVTLQRYFLYNLYRYEIERKLKKEKKERKKQKREEMMKQAASTPSSAASAAAATPTPNSTVNVYSSARENRSKERRQTIETKYDKKARAIEDLKALREKKKKSGRCLTECSSYVEL